MHPRAAALSLTTYVLSVAIPASFVACVHPDSNGAGSGAEGGTSDAGSIPDASTGDTATTGSGDTGSSGDVAVLCDPAIAWPAMLAAPIVPLHHAANLDLNHDGPGVVSRAYAESVNCSLTSFTGLTTPPSWPPQVYGAWGNHQDVQVSSDPTTSELTMLLLQGGYAGAIPFASRAGGAYGTHSYTIGIGHLDRDGTPLNLDWNNPAPFDEILDGLTATFVPAFASVQQCVAAAGCWWGSASPGSSADAGDDAYYFVVEPIAFAVGMDTVGHGGLPAWIGLELPGGLPPADGGADANSGD